MPCEYQYICRQFDCNKIVEEIKNCREYQRIEDQLKNSVDEDTDIQKLSESSGVPLSKLKDLVENY